MSVLLNQKFILSLLLFSIVVAAASLYQRQIGTDDAWLAEQAYWMAQDGHVRSELFHGMNNHHIQHLAYHRLYIWHGVLAYKVFGWSAYIFKSISLVYFLLFLCVSYLFVRKFALFKTATEYQVFYLFILALALMPKLAFIYRPDVMVMAFGFMSFAMLYASVKKQGGYYAAMAGILAGLCVLTHLNGVVFVFAGGIVLLLMKKYRFLIYFSLAAFVVSMFYFIEIRTLGMFNEFLYQLRSSPALSAKDFSLSGSVLKLLSSYKSYFHKGSDASYTLLFLFVFWTQRKTILADENLRLIFIYFVALAIGLALVSPGRKSLYLVYHAPYAFLLIAILYKQILSQALSRQRIFAVILLLFLVTQWGESVKLIKKQTPHLANTHHDISQSMSIPDGARIVAPLTFVFNEIDKYTIKSFHVYRALSGQGLIQLEKDFFRVASEDKRSYLVLTDHHLRDLQVSNPARGDHFGRYYYMGKYGPYHGFRHTK